jgi:small subunit ribosomal protein S1
MHFKKLQQEKKLSSRVERPLAFDERTPLAALLPGMELTGLVISLTKFGAYVDVGTETDGLLHVSQITRDFFVEHPRQVLTPGEEVLVKVRSTNPSIKKLHLTMLNAEDLNEERQSKMEDEEEQAEERIELSELQADDELWGLLKRVTDFGAYVEVGAEVDGFLHFMDHPSWEVGMQPSEFMTRGDRVRVWVADVNTEQRRMKLTANRPGHLPGPRREFN